MTLQKTKSRFLPTLTEVVRPAEDTGVSESVLESVPETLAPEDAQALRERLHAELDAHILAMLPRMHEAIDAAVHAALANAQTRRNTADH